jgi:AcrR family transcriptional regulator
MASHRKSHEAPPAPAGLSRARVCREALALVDEEGLDALSMRRLGARLGVEAMSLYRHVRHKADLLDALHAAVLGDLQPEGLTGRDWRALLGGLCRALRSALLRHPHVLPLFTTRPVTAPEGLATIERVAAALARAGFSPAERDQAIAVTGMFTIGHAIFDAGASQRSRADDRLRAATFTFGLEALLDGIARAHRSPKKRTP